MKDVVDHVKNQDVKLEQNVITHFQPRFSNYSCAQRNFLKGKKS